MVATFAAGINLTDTVVEIVKRYRHAHVQPDFELLLQEVRTAAIEKINGADLALAQFERLLKDKGINLDQPLSVVIAKTSHWSWIEQWQLGDIRKYFNNFSDSIYSACDSVSALARCRDQMGHIGDAVVESARNKRALHLSLLHSDSLRWSIELLRAKLTEYKAAISR